jgi:hypothetical protein
MDGRPVDPKVILGLIEDKQAFDAKAQILKNIADEAPLAPWHPSSSQSFLDQAWAEAILNDPVITGSKDWPFDKKLFETLEAWIQMFNLNIKGEVQRCFSVLQAHALRQIKRAFFWLLGLGLIYIFRDQFVYLTPLLQTLGLENTAIQALTLCFIMTMVVWLAWVNNAHHDRNLKEDSRSHSEQYQLLTKVDALRINKMIHDHLHAKKLSMSLIVAHAEHHHLADKPEGELTRGEAMTMRALELLDWLRRGYKRIRNKTRILAWKTAIIFKAHKAKSRYQSLYRSLYLLDEIKRHHLWLAGFVLIFLAGLVFLSLGIKSDLEAGLWSLPSLLSGVIFVALCLELIQTAKNYRFFYLQCLDPVADEFAIGIIRTLADNTEFSADADYKKSVESVLTHNLRRLMREEKKP